MTIEVEVLRKAKVLIQNGEYFICHALQTIGILDPHYKNAAATLTKIVAKRLGKNVGTLNAWLELQGVSRKQITYKRVKQHRLDWIGILIKEFS